MAVFTGGSQPINMENWVFVAPNHGANDPMSVPETITFDDNEGNFVTFSGTFAEDFMSGTVTGVAETGQHEYTVTGINRTLTEISDAYGAQITVDYLTLLFSGADTFNGGAMGERLTGLGGNDTMIGGGGNDTLKGGVNNDNLNGGAGTDRLFGDPGNDIMTWAAADLFNGGSGNDTIRVTGGGQIIDLRTLSPTKITNTELFNLTGNGNNHLQLTSADVLDLSASTNTLMVFGNAGDMVHRGSGWTRDTTPNDLINGVTYETWTKGSAVLMVDVDVTCTVTYMM